MSAHAGIFYFDGRPVPRESIRRLIAACQPYGPDRSSELCPSPGVALIYRALEVTPEDAFEQQPIALEANRFLTWDGRLDNRSDLAIELGLCHAHALPDSRIVAEGYRRWGDNLFLRLIGDWSLVVWDDRTRVVTLTCDFMAIRSLYYVVCDDYCAWSTALEALVDLTGRGTDFDDDFLQAMMLPAYLPGKTPYRDIQVLPGSHTVSIAGARGSQPRQYWHLPANQIRYRDRRDYAVHLRSVFREAVASRLRTSHAVSMELSGGWDSSTVVCMAARLADEGQFSGHSLETISYVRPDSPEADETRFIEAVTTHTGLPSIRVPLEADALPNFPAPAHVRDVNPAIVSAYARLRAAEVRTVLTGASGDGVMGNFPLDVTSIVWSLRSGHLIEFIRQLRAWSLASQRTAWQLLALVYSDFSSVDVEAKDLVRHFVATRTVQGNASAQMARALLNERMLELVFETNAAYVRWSRQEEHAHVSRRFLRGLAYVMLTGRCASPPEAPDIIKTHPYRDRRVVEYVGALPWSTVCEPGRPRSLMRDAFGPILPDRVSRRFSKGNARPFYARRMASLASVLTAPLVTPIVVDRGYVSALVLADHLGKCQGDASVLPDALLGITMLEYWLINTLRTKPHNVGNCA